jgi:hypothetical protein
LDGDDIRKIGGLRTEFVLFCESVLEEATHVFKLLFPVADVVVGSVYLCLLEAEERLLFVVEDGGSEMKLLLNL